MPTWGLRVGAANSYANDLYIWKSYDGTVIEIPNNTHVFESQLISNVETLNSMFSIVTVIQYSLHILLKTELKIKVIGPQ